MHTVHLNHFVSKCIVSKNSVIFDAIVKHNLGRKLASKNSEREKRDLPYRVTKIVPLANHFQSRQLSQARAASHFVPVSRKTER